MLFPLQIAWRTYIALLVTSTKKINLMAVVGSTGWTPALTRRSIISAGWQQQQNRSFRYDKTRNGQSKKAYREDQETAINKYKLESG